MCGPRWTFQDHSYLFVSDALPRCNLCACVINDKGDNLSLTLVLTPVVKLKLLRAYCSDLYGSTLRNLSDSSIEEVCAVWCKGLRRALGLPWRTHSVLLAPITGMLSLRDELFCRMAKFVLQCFVSSNSIVNFVALHGVYFRRMSSPIGLNTKLCCERYNVSFTALASLTES